MMRAIDPHQKLDELRQAPHNIELEQALLGAILINNNALDRISGLVEAHHFFEPLHGRIFLAIEQLITKGQRADPLSLRPFFEAEEPLGNQKLPVMSYLGRLCTHATSVITARDYALNLRQYADRREMILIGEDLSGFGYEMPPGATPIEEIEAAEGRLFQLGQGGAESVHDFTAKAAAAVALDMISKAYERDSSLAGMSVDLTDLDRLLGGLAPSDLIILAGRPSMGKSALASNIAFNVARGLMREHGDLFRAGKVDEKSRCGEVSFYSLEMSAEQLMMREISRKTGIPGERLRRGQLNEDGRGGEPPLREFSANIMPAVKDLADLPLHIDSTGGLKIAQFVARARRRKRLHDTRLIIVDYLQLMSSGNNRDNRAAEVAEITVALKAIAKELDVPIIALSQLSREVEKRENKRPQLSDLRESGAIEQDADIVMFVYREEYYLKRAAPPEHRAEEYAEWQNRMDTALGEAEIILGKHRHGPIDTIKLHFDEKTASFSNLAR